MRRFVVVLASLGLLLAACGSAAETIAEKIVENETGGDVEFDDGVIVIESDDGDATVEISEDEDGITITGTDDSGDEVSIEMGGTEVPDDFPMPIFDPSEVTHVSTFAVGSGSSFSVTLEIDPDDAGDALAFYQDWFEEEGLSVMSSGEMVIADNDDVTSIVQVAEYGSYSEVVLSWTPKG
ncbi:MAG: hypothetical protein OEX97_01715 [Acidimicrobiia bacterium]|nr:hypothetical protein [Acidimicrobiia bacterium]